MGFHGMTITLGESQQSEFKEWAVSRVKKEFRKGARDEVGWMILGYGLRCVPDKQIVNKINEENNQYTKE